MDMRERLPIEWRAAARLVAFDALYLTRFLSKVTKDRASCQAGRRGAEAWCPTGKMKKWRGPADGRARTRPQLPERRRNGRAPCSGKEGAPRRPGFSDPAHDVSSRPASQRSRPHAAPGPEPGARPGVDSTSQEWPVCRTSHRRRRTAGPSSVTCIHATTPCRGCSCRNAGSR